MIWSVPRLRNFGAVRARGTVAGLLVLCVTLAEPAWADFRGEVIGVTDGDTVKVLRDGREQVKIRLAEIDAPEKKQPFGQRSRQSLAELVFRKQVLVVEQGKDRYERTIARLKVGDLDANEEQVRRGLDGVGCGLVRARLPRGSGDGGNNPLSRGEVVMLKRSSRS